MAHCGQRADASQRRSAVAGFEAGIVWCGFGEHVPSQAPPCLRNTATVHAVHAFWRYDAGVPSIQVKDVPDDVHATLRRRAATAGQSLQEYLLARLIDDARAPTLDELLERAGGRAGGRASLKDAADAVRADRDSR